MKKTLITLAFGALILFTTSAKAQEFHLGAKAGANLGKIDGAAYNQGFKLGYQLGGFAEFDFSDRWGVQGEVLFSQTNTELKDNYQAVWKEKFNKKKTLNYVSVPVLLKYNPGGFISLHAGPQFSFLANSEDSTWENGKKLFKGTDFSLLAGAEVNLGPLFAYGRYVWGYTDINSALTEKATTQQIQLGVGVRF
ncbi:porin family protein [Capnocytophaga sp. oral taxon 878]|uniref:porin family protein n=1 Tax=Capnocytophaga sp. oral taxon 878 TaxID=1316596 RepID=UPI000D02FD61|nr:porin family protein [Capnocytophaga sp. oral taxon 878]AVM49828.1 hypothetical protein C4H12_04750 [Capnocytophaga sp. oral taxon 878]